jgi:acetyl esterase/lipase
VKELGVNPKDIAICGRSIGTGPAVFLAANRDPGALILISPFKSIQDTAKSILGIFKFLVSDR